MTTKIDHLTQEQERQLVAFREEWRQIGLATGPVNMEKVAPIIRDFYFRIGEEESPVIWRCSSPFMAQIWINLLRTIVNSDTKPNQYLDSLDTELSENLGETADMYRNLPNDLFWIKELHSEMYEELHRGLPGTMYDMYAGLINNLSYSLRAKLGDELDPDIHTGLVDDLIVYLRNNLRAELHDASHPASNFETDLRHKLRDNLTPDLVNALRSNLRAAFVELGKIISCNLDSDPMDSLYEEIAGNLYDISPKSENMSKDLREKLDKILWCPSLPKGREARDAERGTLSRKMRNDIPRHMVENSKLYYTPTSMWGSLDNYWVAYYLFPQLYLKLTYSADQMEILNGWEGLARNCFWIYPFKGICFVCDRPTVLWQDERRHLHNDNGPAYAFSDGWEEYYIHGVHVPSWLIEQPQDLVAQKIDEEEDAEVRRVMMERYTVARYMRESNAVLVSEDRFGKLWRKLVANDEPVQMVEVRNATPEPDGTYKTYWLRVNPEVKTAHEAVASTWVDENNQPIFENYRDYQPMLES